MTTVTTPRPPRITWRAAADRVGHAHVGARPLTTVRGEAVIEERFAWPAARRCRGCEALLAERDGRLD